MYQKCVVVLGNSCRGGECLASVAPYSLGLILRSLLVTYLPLPGPAPPLPGADVVLVVVEFPAYSPT